MISEQNSLCYLCGWQLGEAPIDGLDPEDWMPTFDHIKPVTEGGRHHQKNLAIAHLVCNQEKGKQEYARKRESERLSDTQPKGTAQ